MKLGALVSVAACVACAGCSSWDTGSSSVDGAEQACVETIETFARAAERCGREYRSSYDALLRRDANGDCKNVRTIRDEPLLRNTCLPFVRTQPCDDLTEGRTDPSCARQLLRSL